MEAVGDNPRSSSEAVAHKTRRGFSLIEAAFVLAVVGAVIGTIWVSAAKFYEEYKVSKTVEGLFTISQNIQNLISFLDAETIGNDVNISDALEDAGVIPDDWRSAKIGYLTNPLNNNFNGGVVVNRILIQGFQISLYGPISESKCMKLVTRTSAIATKLNSNLFFIGNSTSFGGTAREITTFPASPEDAQTFCAGGAWDFYFRFRYTRIN